MVGFIVLAIVCAGVAVAVVRYRLKKKRKKENEAQSGRTAAPAATRQWASLQRLPGETHAARP